MRKFTVIIAVVTAMLAMVVVSKDPAQAAIATITTGDQQSVSQTSPNTSDCGAWSPINGSSTAKKRIEVSFNTAGVVPAGNTLTSVVLRVFPKANYSGNNLSVKSYTRTGVINCNVTWNNLGTVGAQVGISSGNFTKNTYKSITLDSASVNVSGRTAFVLDASVAALMEFRSDASGPNLNPSKLDLTYAPSPTTTTVAETTTTTTPEPTTTTTAPPSCEGPITISSGQTISDRCFESTNSSTPAVSIATSAQVNLMHVTIRHAGFGVRDASANIHVKVENSKFQALTPTTNGSDQFAFYMYMPAAVEFIDNDVRDGHGFLVNGNNALTSPFIVNRNNFINTGKLSQPSCSAGNCLGAVHTDKVLAPGGQIQWNRSVNTYGQSLTEDVFGFYFTNGAEGNPIDVSNNLVDGSYPYAPADGSTFNGGAFDLADGNGSYLEGHDNVAVNYTNNGFMIPSGQYVHHTSSIAVNDGLAGSSGSGSRVSSPYGAGATTWHNPNYPASTDIGMINIQAGHLRWNGTTWESQDFYLPEGTNSGNSSIPATNEQELTAVTEFEARAGAAAIGTDW
jgi:hypothetical protein